MAGCDSLTFHDWVPPIIYESLFTLARKHHLAVKEVEWTLVREALKPFGFKCNHERVGTARATGLAFCKDCYQRLQQVKKPTYEGKKVIEPAEYRELPTFMNPKPELIKVSKLPIKKKLSSYEQIAEALKAADGLQPDQRGGE